MQIFVRFISRIFIYLRRIPTKMLYNHALTLSKTEFKSNVEATSL